MYTRAAIDVAPLLDRLVVFRSADVDHEVLPTTVRRLSLTGWMSRPGHGCTCMDRVSAPEVHSPPMQRTTGPVLAAAPPK